MALLASHLAGIRLEHERRFTRGRRKTARPVLVGQWPALRLEARRRRRYLAARAFAVRSVPLIVARNQQAQRPELRAARVCAGVDARRRELREGGSCLLYTSPSPRDRQ